MFPQRRMRRLRKEGIREIVAETNIKKSDLIAPIFVDATIEDPLEVESMPEVYRYPLDKIEKKAKEIEESGISTIIVFGIPKTKDEKGSRAYADDGIVQKAVKRIDKNTDLVIITDVCMCEYTDHGHCGIIKKDEKSVHNDLTLEYLKKIAVSHAHAGCDIVAPSGMMDGQVKAIRDGLDNEDLEDISILSYSVKYNSAFYGPFRDAAESSPSFGNRKEYQMNPSNINTAIEEAKLDIKEGADILMVKPALPYLDVLTKINQKFNIPTAAYNVSGEYAMLKAAEEKGWLNIKSTSLESLISIKRAGADMILTYFAEEIAKEI